jgi:radical SAM superfamily enzyme YgiQ (UPF0313 family)
LRVLLVNSNLKDDFFSAPPIGLCYVASAAEAAGHEVKALDLCFERNIRRRIKNCVRDFRPEVVGISVRNIDNVNMLHPVSYMPDVQRIANYVREFTTVPLVLGGAGASLLPAATLKLLKGDFIVVSEGERAFVELLDRLAKGAAAKDVPGVGFMEGQRFRSTTPCLGDLDGGKPDIGKWIDVRDYQALGSSYSVLTRRGCRHRCIYCAYNQVLEGCKIRLRNPVEVVDEIEEAVMKYAPESFEFVDSVFNDPLEHCIEVLEEIVRRPWKARFTAMGVAPKGLDDQLLDLMWRAGFRSFWLSPESASQTMLRNYGKWFTVDDVSHAAEAISRTRFTAIWCFLIGGPGETNETLQESLDFTMKFLRRDSRPPLNLASFYFGVRVYPRTRLWDVALAESFVTEENNPLQQLWYISEELDLDRAFKQFAQVVYQCPEISGGFQEMFMPLSGVAARLANFYGIAKPYWAHMVRANEIFYKMRLHWLFPLPDLAERVRRQLAAQGYQGVHLAESNHALRRRALWKRIWGN